MEVQQGLPPQRARSRVPAMVGLGIFIAGLLVGMVVAGFRIAGAQTPSASPKAGAPYKEFRHGFGHRGFGHGLGGVLHGEFTAPKPGGGFQTVDVQRGEVTSVSGSSITVKSDDGFTKTYTVDNNTLVNAGNNGIADVAKGDTVQIVAIKSGSTVHAVDVADLTKIKDLRGKYFFHRERPKPSSSASASATTF
jgi:hypothetical protein